MRCGERWASAGQHRWIALVQPDSGGRDRKIPAGRAVSGAVCVI